MTLKALAEDADALVQLRGIERAAYIGRFGWVTVTIAEQASLDLALDLIATSYELVTRKGRARARG